MESLKTRILEFIRHNPFKTFNDVHEYVGTHEEREVVQQALSSLIEDDLISAYYTGDKRYDIVEHQTI